MTSSYSNWIKPLLPGLALAFAVALVAYLAEPALKAMTGGRLSLPATVIALIIGISIHDIASRGLFQPGLVFCVKKVLRWVIGLLGLRIALGDILGLGIGTILIVVVSMALTIASGLLLARLLGRPSGFGALAGAACAVCGASATLATATVVPDYKEKSADVAFTVVMANAISTVAMLAYPLLCIWLGLSPQATGIMLGATIHDMAQVVGGPRGRKGRDPGPCAVPAFCAGFHCAVPSQQPHDGQPGAVSQHGLPFDQILAGDGHQLGVADLHRGARPWHIAEGDPVDWLAACRGVHGGDNGDTLVSNAAPSGHEVKPCPTLSSANSWMKQRSPRGLRALMSITTLPLRTSPRN